MDGERAKPQEQAAEGQRMDIETYPWGIRLVFDMTIPERTLDDYAIGVGMVPGIREVDIEYPDRINLHFDVDVDSEAMLDLIKKLFRTFNIT